MTTTSTRTPTVPRPRTLRRSAGPTSTPPVRGHRPTGRGRARAWIAAASVVAAGAGTAVLWAGLSGNDAVPEAPGNVPFQSSLPQGIDGSDARLYNRAAELAALQESASGSDQRLLNMAPSEVPTDGSDQRLHNLAE